MSDEQNQSLVETVSSIENGGPEIPAALSPKTQQQMEVIKSLFLEGDDRSYGEKIAEAGVKLGKTERTIWRLVKKWRDDGLVGLTQIGRSDKGSSRLDEDWQ
jgi:putative transposase